MSLYALYVLICLICLICLIWFKKNIWFKIIPPKAVLIIYLRVMILQRNIQEVIETAKIEEVVGDFVNLKRRGVNMIGLCPFHHEKTPSFTVSPGKNIYKCFGCGKGGDPIRFIMDQENLTFTDAIRYLAKKYNIEIEEKELSAEEIQQRHHLESLYLLNDFARDFYARQLFETDKGKSIGLNYFKERGYMEETIRKFALGFAPEDKDGLTQEAIGKGYKKDLLQKVGLTSNTDRDFFRNRVIFPIHGLTGKVVAFAGRILRKDINAPKYINSPETEIYNKSKTLYGLYFAKKTIQQEDECILVEGYTDVISLHQSGIENVVASSGTSLTVEQIRAIKRFTPNIKIIYDGDPAGIKAALRGLNLALEEDMNVRIVLLPLPEDPDSYLKKAGVTAFKEYITKADDFILFKTKLLKAEAGTDPIRKTQLVKEIVESIALIPDAIKRSFFIKSCSTELQVDENILFEEMNKLLRKQVNKKQQHKPFGSAAPEDIPQEDITQDQGIVRHKTKKTPFSGDEFQEKDIARVLVLFGDKLAGSEENVTIAHSVLSNIEDVMDCFDNQLYHKVVQEVLRMLVNNIPVTLSHFIVHEDREIASFSIDVASQPYEFSENWANRWEIYLQMQQAPEENFLKDSIQALKRFKLKKIGKKRDEIMVQLKISQEEDDPERTIGLLKLIKKLNEMRNQLAKEMNTVVLK